MHLLYLSLGFVLSSVLRYRSSISLQNISRAFPMASYQEVSKYQHGFYTYLARILCESLLMVRSRLLVAPDALEKLEELREQNRNVILIFGHFGNWEVLNQLPLHVPTQVQALYKPIKSGFWDKRVKSIRSKYGTRLIPASQGLRVLLKERDQASINLFIADQYPGKNNGLDIEFLHQKTQVFTGAEQIARKLNSYVAYAEILPRENSTWELRIQEICSHAATTEPGDISKKFINKLENSIRQNPSNWLWSHKRWKK